MALDSVKHRFQMWCLKVRFLCVAMPRNFILSTFKILSFDIVKLGRGW